jgi:uncharacterized protein (TIGR02145 family)
MEHGGEQVSSCPLPDIIFSSDCVWKNNTVSAGANLTLSLLQTAPAVANNYGRCTSIVLRDANGGTTFPSTYPAMASGIKLYAQCGDDFIVSTGTACPIIITKDPNVCTAVDNTETQYCSNKEWKDYDFVEDADGNIYKTIVIGEQTWMAENLNYQTENSKCYSNFESNCDIYGRLYNWSDALDVCPEGWHIPSQDEWNELSSYIGGSITEGKHLKATSGWNSNGNGLDTYGFAALPGGLGFFRGGFSDARNGGYWWSSDEYSSSDAYSRSMDRDDENALWLNYDKSDLRSVRCLQGQVRR